jgi:hypothetical protein
MPESANLPLYAALALASALTLMLVFAWTRRSRAEKRYTAQLRDREERLRLALWASSEQYWDYDLKTGHMHRMWVEARGHHGDLQVRNLAEGDHRIHPDDRAGVDAKLRAHCAARPSCSSPSTASSIPAASGSGSAPADARWSPAATAAPAGSPAPPATSPAAARPSASAGSRSRCCAA